LPVGGRLTTEFGETRYVNDFPTSYRHLGLDIAAPEGTEVKASNRGKVVLARSLILTGNTVMIDHGEGLFSVYHHLLKLSVKAGAVVERGQKIGEVGSTGFSTGPHLHFMISYFTTNLEPGYVLFGQPVTYENYEELFQ
jgi:murein DD-endopeptidase MepM/ murein hydrolase activator NlpD